MARLGDDEGRERSWLDLKERGQRNEMGILFINMMFFFFIYIYSALAFLLFADGIGARTGYG